MTGFKSKKTAALDEDGMHLVHQTASAPFSLSAPSLETPSITFIGGNAEWVMRITADRRIEVNEGVQVTEAAQKVLDALQHLLPPQPAQEPVAWAVVGDGKFGEYELGQVFVDYEATHTYWENRGYELVPVYTTPPQRPWVGLTDEEAQWLYDNCRTPSNLIDMVEAKLKEKNT